MKTITEVSVRQSGSVHLAGDVFRRPCEGPVSLISLLAFVENAIDLHP